jgi:hypothetical protein
MPYPVYKLVHFLGIFILIASLTAGAMHALRGGTKADNPHRRTLGILHGVSLFLILLGGFGMLARLEIIQGGLPGWIWGKLVIWIVLGAALALTTRGREPARLALITVPLLAVAAGAIALYKPF